MADQERVRALREALEDAERSRVSVRDRMEQAERRLQELQEQEARIKLEEEGLRFAIARATGEDVVRPDNAGSPTSRRVRRIRRPRSWDAMPRTDAVERALREAGGEPLSPADLTTVLSGHGREGDEPNFVSSTLARLSNQDPPRAVNVGFAKWIHPEFATEDQMADAESEDHGEEP